MEFIAKYVAKFALSQTRSSKNHIHRIGTSDLHQGILSDKIIVAFGFYQKYGRRFMIKRIRLFALIYIGFAIHAFAQPNINCVDALKIIDLGANRTVCFNADTTLVVPPGSYSSVKWTAPFAVPSGSLRVQITAGGTYKVTVTDKNGCAASGQVVINFADGLKNFDLGSYLRIFCFNQDNRIALPAGSYQEIQWYAPDSVPDGSLYYNVKQPGSVSVKITDATGCAVTDSVRFVYADSLTLSQGCVIRSPAKSLQIPGVVQAEDYDLGAEGVTYHDHDNANTGGTYRTDGVDIEICSEGGFDVTNIVPGEWLEYTVQVQQSGIYSAVAAIASEAGTGAFHFVIDPADAHQPSSDTIHAPDTGGVQQWASGETMLTMPEGDHVLRIWFDSGAFNLDKITFDYLSGIASVSGDPGVDKEIKIFPNPFLFNTTVDLGNLQNAGIEISSSSGTVIRQYQRQSGMISAGDNLAPGIYIVRINAGDTFYNIKIVKLE
jgi:hypothetical protein